MLVGYARSTREGAFPAVEDATLRSVGCEVVFADSCGSSSAEPQPELARALESLQPRDVLLVTALDCLGGGLRELIARVVQVQAKGASVRTLQGSFDTRTANGRELLEALLSFDRGLTRAPTQHGAKATQPQAQALDRPPMLDAAAARLDAAHTPASGATQRSHRSLGANSACAAAAEPSRSTACGVGHSVDA